MLHLPFLNFVNVRHQKKNICHNRFITLLFLIGNGVSIRAPFFEIEFSNLTSNAKTGFMYNPHYTSYEALQLRTGIHDSEVQYFYLINIPNFEPVDTGCLFLTFYPFLYR